MSSPKTIIVASLKYHQTKDDLATKAFTVEALNTGRCVTSTAVKTVGA